MLTLTANDIKELNIPMLAALVDSGIITITSDIPVTEIQEMSKEDLPEYKKFFHLADKLLSISEAAREYNISKTTISQWIRRGIIPIQETQGNKKLISEQDIAYCALIRSRNPGAGKWLFNPDGTPYVSASE